MPSTAANIPAPPPGYQLVPVDGDPWAKNAPADGDPSAMSSGKPPRFQGMPVGPRFQGIPEPPPGYQLVPVDHDPFAAPQDGSISADNAARATATGVPIVGGMLNGIDAATNATLAPLVDPLLPDSFQKLPGKTWDERYQQALNIQNGKDAAFEAQHPYVDKGLNVAGAVAGTIPAVMAAPAAFGAGGGGILMRGAASTLTGGAIGGADSAVRSGGDPWETFKGGVWGAGGGAAALPLGAAIGWAGKTGAQKIADAIYWATHGSDVPASVANSIVSNLGRQGDTAGSAIQRIAEMGPGATLADSGPAAQGMAVKLAAQYPEVGPQMTQNLTARADQFGPRMNSTVDAAAGPDVNAPQQMAALKATTQANGAANYAKAFANQAPVDVTPTVARIDSAIYPSTKAGTTLDPISSALQEARGYITGPNVGQGSIETLHRAQDVIDDMASSAFRNGDNAKAKTLWDVRSSLLNQMDAANPDYALARSQYASDKAVENAFENGRSIFAPKSDGQVYDPDLLESRLATMSPPEQQAFQLGTRKALTDTMGTARTDAAGVKNLLSNGNGYPVQKLRQIIGDGPTNQLLKELDHQAAMQDTNNIVTRNSKTALASAADGDIPTAVPLGGAAHEGGYLTSVIGGGELGELAGHALGYPEIGRGIGTGIGIVSRPAVNMVANAINAAREGSAGVARSGVANVLTSPMRQNVAEALMAYQAGRPNLAAIRQGAAIAGRAILVPVAQAANRYLTPAPQ
ncbi:hypothetical protein ACWGS9_34280 [Bradyrhizobium sp. Arg314]